MLPTNDEIRESLRRGATPVSGSGYALKFARAAWFDEIPGLIFAIFTLAWICISFAGLAGFDLKPVGDEVMGQVHRLAHHLPPHSATILSRAGTVAGIARHGWNLIAAKDCA